MKNIYVKKYLIFLIVVMSIRTVQAKETVVLNENILKKYINNEVPIIEKINMSYEQGLQLKNLFDENYMFNLSGSVGYSKNRLKSDLYSGPYSTTQETRDISFTGYDNNLIPVNGISLNKKFVHGINLLVNTEYNQNKIHDSDAIYSRNAIAPFSMQFSIDLWKNFLGYSELAKKSSIDYGINEAKIKRNIELNSFFINVRKMYWTLIANDKMILFIIFPP